MLVLLEFSAGCSMTEPKNNGGHDHDRLHRLFESKELKMRRCNGQASVQYITVQ